MVCLLCDSKTRITNSRYISKTARTWRRHACPRCHTVYTTYELVDTAGSYRLKLLDGSLQPLNRDQLLLELAEALNHRQNALSEAGALTDTIIAEVVRSKRLLINIRDYQERIAKILRHFDQTAAIKYASTHRH